MAAKEKTTVIDLPYQAQPRQQLMHETLARQIMYGGAAGGGKSEGMRWDAIAFCIHNPGLDAYLFRRTRVELENTHIKRVKPELPAPLGSYNQTRNRFEFWNGSFLNMCYAEHEDDVHNYNSVEFHWLGVDEAGQFTPYQIAYLRSRMRLGGFTPAANAAQLPRCVLSCNPGGISHHYLKSTFIDAAPPETVFHDATMRDPSNPDDKGWSTIFIPAKIEDNKYLDAGYAAAFGGLPDHMQRMLRDGDWNVVAGAYFDCWETSKHVLQPFQIPRGWLRFRSVDWGHATPFSVGWWAVSDGSVDGMPTGALVRYREWYGAPANPVTGRVDGTKGLRMDAGDVAKEILARSVGEDIAYTVIDPSSKRTDSGPSPAEKMMRAGLPLVWADRAREPGWAELYGRLRGVDGVPMIYFFDTCVDTVRTLPVLQADMRRLEDVDTTGEDHAADDTRYACMSRPWVKVEKVKKPPRWQKTMSEMIGDLSRRRSGGEERITL